MTYSRHPHVYGIPLPMLDYGILWTQAQHGPPTSPSAMFPSWAWVGCIDPCSYQFALSIMHGYNKSAETWPIADITKAVPKDSTIEFETTAVNGRMFASREDEELARLMPLRLYSTLYVREGLCGFLLGCLPMVAFPSMSKMIRLAGPLLPNLRRDLYEDWRICREWMEKVGRATEAIIVVMIVKDNRRYMERLGLGILFVTAWERLRQEKVDVRLA